VDGLNPKNDTNFRYFPFQFITNEQLINEKDSQALQSRLKIFTRKKEEIALKIQAKVYEQAIIPELNIEIQKGNNFYHAGLCLLEGKPFVSVSLEPNGPKFETFESNIFKPYWYRFFQLKQIIPYAKIVFSVLAKQRYGKNKLIGSCEIKVSDLSSQSVKEEWLSLKSSLKSEPMLRVRVQHVYNEEKLLNDFLQAINEKIGIIESALRNPLTLNYF